MKKLIIFDLDGTLLNTIADLAAATNYALEQCNYPTHPEDAYYYFVGNGINKLFERALPEEARTIENVLKIRSHFVPYYNAHNCDLSRPYPGIPELLEALQNAGLQLAVASNKYHEATVKLIERFFPEIHFAAVFGQRDNVPTKPDPTVVEEIIGLCHVRKEEVLYVGDSCVDMQTGKNAQVETVGVSWGFRPRKELEDNGATHIIDKAADLLQLV